MAEAAQNHRILIPEAKHLNGDCLLELVVVTLRPVYCAHSTLTDATRQAVGTYTLAAEIGGGECGRNVLDSLASRMQGAVGEGKQRLDLVP